MQQAPAAHEATVPMAAGSQLYLLYGLGCQICISIADSHAEFILQRAASSCYAQKTMKMLTVAVCLVINL